MRQAKLVDVAAMVGIYVVLANDPDVWDKKGMGDDGPVSERKVPHVLKNHSFQKHPRGSSPPSPDINSLISPALPEHGPQDDEHHPINGAIHPPPVEHGTRAPDAG